MFFGKSSILLLFIVGLLFGGAFFVNSVVHVEKISAATCSSLIYPSGIWQRVWYTYNPSTSSIGICLGDGPNESLEKFNTDWGSSFVGGETNGTNGYQPDNIMFTSGRKISIPVAGRYQFTVGADDGIRLWIGSGLYINEWSDGGYRTHSTNYLDMEAVDYNFALDYYENTGDAKCKRHRSK